MARGELSLSSSSDDDDDLATDSEASEREDVPNGDASRRLAMVNVDWEQLTAQDLFVLFQSFKPELGDIRSVTVYPSEYGTEMMAKEARLGPQIWADGNAEDRGKDVNRAASGEDSGEGSDDGVGQRMFRCPRIRPSVAAETELSPQLHMTQLGPFLAQHPRLTGLKFSDDEDTKAAAAEKGYDMEKLRVCPGGG